MMMMTRAALSLNLKQAERMRRAIPAACPLTVHYEDQRFVVRCVDPQLPLEFTGRFEVVNAFITGFQRAWMSRYTFRPDHNGECLNCDEWADAHGPDEMCRVLVLRERE